MDSAKKIKRKYRFNIIDILLLVVIAVAVGLLIFLAVYDGKKDGGEKEADLSGLIYTVEQTYLPDVLRGKINIGDTVIDAKTMKNVGQVIDVEYIDAVYNGFDSENNTRVDSVYPGKINLRVRISVDASVDENGIFSANGTVLNVGEKMDLRFPYYTGEGVCIAVSEVGE